MRPTRLRAAGAFAASVVGVHAVAALLLTGVEEGGAQSLRLWLPYVVWAGVPAGLAGALAGPALARARSEARAALGGAGVVVVAAVLYAVGSHYAHLAVGGLPFGLSWADLAAESAGGGLLSVLGSLSGYGLILLVSVVLGVITLLAVPVGAGAGWWLWSRARREPSASASGAR